MYYMISLNSKGHLAPRTSQNATHAQVFVNLTFLPFVMIPSCRIAATSFSDLLFRSESSAPDPNSRTTSSLSRAAPATVACRRVRFSRRICFFYHTFPAPSMFEKSNHGNASQIWRHKRTQIVI
jgi:hypothetical protein